MAHDMLLRQQVTLQRGLMIGEKRCITATIREQDGGTMLTCEQAGGGDILQGLTLLSCIIESFQTDNGLTVPGPFEVAILKKLAGRDLEALLNASAELEQRGRDGGGA